MLSLYTGLSCCYRYILMHLISIFVWVYFQITRTRTNVVPFLCVHGAPFHTLSLRFKYYAKYPTIALHWQKFFDTLCLVKVSLDHDVIYKLIYTVSLLERSRYVHDPILKTLSYLVGHDVYIYSTISSMSVYKCRCIWCVWEWHCYGMGHLHKGTWIFLFCKVDWHPAVSVLCNCNALFFFTKMFKTINMYFLNIPTEMCLDVPNIA